MSIKMNYPAAELTGYQTALTALFFEAKLRGIHPKGLNEIGGETIDNEIVIDAVDTFMGGN
jgi:hypothetical protein